MRTIVLCSVGALLLGASAMGCYDEPEQPAVRSSHHAVVSQPAAPQQTGSVTVVHHDDQPQQGVMSQQPAPQPTTQSAQPNTPVINNFVEAPPANSASQAQTTQAPSAEQLPAQQPSPAAQPNDDRARASQVVAEATQQIDRLTRVLSMSAKDSHHADIEAAVGQLQSKRERVLHDLKGIETSGASASSDDTQHIMLNRDVSELQSVLQKSYEYAPKTNQ